MSTIAVIADQLHPLVISFADPVYQGQVIEMDFSYTDELGSNDITNTLWAFHLRKKGETGIPFISKSTGDLDFPIDPPPVNLAKLRLSSAETKTLDAGVAYEFEVWLTVATARPFMAGTGQLKVKAPIAYADYSDQ